MTKGTRDLLKIALVSAGVLVAAILLFGRTLIGLFTETEAVLELGVMGLRWLALGYLAFSVSQVLQGTMRGAGETIAPMWLSIVQLFGIRVPFAYLLCYLTRSPSLPNGMCEMTYVSLLMSFTIGCLLHWLYYRRGTWKKAKRV